MNKISRWVLMMVLFGCACAWGANPQLPPGPIVVYSAYDNNITYTNATNIEISTNGSVYNYATFNQNTDNAVLQVINNGVLYNGTSANHSSAIFNNNIDANVLINGSSGTNFFNWGDLENSGDFSIYSKSENDGVINNKSSGNFVIQGTMTNYGNITNNGNRFDITGVLNHNSGVLTNNATPYYMYIAGTLNSSSSFINNGEIWNLTGSVNINQSFANNSGARVLNQGTVNIGVASTVNNYGTFDNGFLYSSVFPGVLNIAGYFNNRNQLNNYSGSTITNTSFNFNNFATITNNGTITNNQKLANYGTINNAGTFTNNGVIWAPDPFAGPRAIINTGTFTSSGNILGSHFTNQGTFDPVGAIQLSGTYTEQGRLLINIVSALSYDYVFGIGNLEFVWNVGGTLPELVLTVVNPLVEGDFFDILRYTGALLGVEGQKEYALLTVTGTPIDSFFDVFYDIDISGGHAVRLVYHEHQEPVVPEPGTYATMGGFLMLMLWMGRRRALKAA